LKNLLVAVKDWKNLAFAGSMLAVAAWVYSRVAMVNPAILGDEYLYSINARKAAPWDPSPAGDFSNYLFNLVYSSTNLCGDAFYTCGKLLNLVFFVGFLTVIFIIAKRYMNFWIAFAFTILAGLSPLSVYTSMFLPESMYFFFLSLVFAAVLKAADTYAWKDWALVGALIGVTSLVKPHAWLSAIAIGIFLVVLGLTNAKNRFGPLAKAIGAISLGAILGRVIIGFLVAGPKALSFFGQYLNAGVVEQIGATAPADSGAATSAVATTPMNGVLSLFGTQFNIHMLTIAALMGVAILGVTVGVIELARTRELTKVTALSLFAFIWLFSLVIEVVVFTGWITGGGDDHTTRVLERYYDFLFIVVPLAGLAALTSKFMAEAKIWIRLPLAVVMLVLITPAFSGFFGTLTIQIADAPNLAGLVVNQEVFNAAALFSFASLIVFAFFPKFTPLVLIGLFPVTMVGTGYQIQDQYQGFRGELNAQDKAGQYLRANLTPEQVDSTWIAATSRFEATNVAIWADSAAIKYDLFGAASVLDASLVPEGTAYVLVTGDLTYSGAVLETIAGEGYTLHKIAD
jgi:phosphoglycerol transferase